MLHSRPKPVIPCILDRGVLPGGPTDGTGQHIVGLAISVGSRGVGE